jgi:uncharacterized membrane protein
MRAPSVPLSKLGRAAHDVGMAGLLGGNLFARLALHPSVTEIRDEAERGKVVNAAWRRYGTINSLSLLAIGAGWIGARAEESKNANLSPTERKLAYAKDALVAAVAVTGIASGVQGMRFAKQAPDGAVPLTDGDHAAPSATDTQKRMKRRLSAIGLANLASEIGLVAVNASLAQQNFRRPPARRFFRRI